MTLVTANPPRWTWSEDVLTFARQVGVEAYLDPLMQATRELFPQAREIRVFVSKDREIAELSVICWEADVPEDRIGDYRSLDAAWFRTFQSICPSQPTRLDPFVHLIFPVQG